MTEPLEGPYFKSSGSAQEARAGQTVFFQCDVGNLGGNVISWKNDTSDRIIYAGSVNILNDPRLGVENNGRRLRMENVTSHDAGVYVCRVETYLNPISLMHRLYVLSKRLLSSS